MFLFPSPYQLRYNEFSRTSSLVVPLLAYLLMKEDLTPEEVNGHAIDIVTGGVDTVRYLEF